MTELSPSTAAAEAKIRALVTGVAGFIGSTLTELLLDAGHSVVGVDCFTDYYAFDAKCSNMAELIDHPAFTFVHTDLRDADCTALLDGIDVLFHLAAQPGVRLSWSAGFQLYAEHNILVTQRLLEAARGVDLQRFVFASSSSVYGDRTSYPTTEDELPKPNSPYGVTKLAAEHLCSLYAANWGIATVALRYFTVYGPRQRPDMAINRIIGAALTGEPFPLFGGGGHIRDFTFVEDVASATSAAGLVALDAPGTAFNVAGGGSTSMRELLALAGRVVGSDVVTDHRPPQPGDVFRTEGATDRATAILGWKPRVSLEAGVAAQVAWQTKDRSNDTARVRRWLSATSGRT